MKYNFIVGNSYTRKDVFEISGRSKGSRGGIYSTGYYPYKGDWFIFCNIGVAGRTGHDYSNQFVGDELLWFGKNGTRKNQPTIQSLISTNSKVYIFTRTDNRDPFNYAGLGKAKLVEDTCPVRIVWEFVDKDEFQPTVLAEEVLEAQKYWEGATKQISVNIYERNPEARRKCIERYGSNCYVCGFNFKQIYGGIGENFIHVHHLKSISEIGQEYQIDPIRDLCPVCPNCHAMLHQKKPAYTIGELKDIIRKARQL